MRVFKKMFLSLILVLGIFLPQMTFAKNTCEDGVFKTLVVCGRTSTSACGNTQPCQLKDIFTVLGNIVYDVIILLLMLVPIYIMYLGIQMILQRGIPKQLSELRKKMLWTVFYLIIIFGAWLIIQEVVKAFNISSDVPSFMLDNNGTPIQNPGPSIR